MSRQPIVVKVGTSLIAARGGRLRRAVLAARAREIAELVRAGSPVVVVSSGAIALGLPRLGLTRRPTSMPKLQAASALGQARLQQAWDAALARHGIPSAQVLLTAADISDRVAYVNARNTLGALGRFGAVAIVNENDATATDEITFGDNDALAAHVAVLVRARTLVLLTEVEGVFSTAPGSPDAKLITEGAQTRDAELGGPGHVGKGGMRSKVLAAEMAASAGIRVVITSGVGEEVLSPIAAGVIRGTVFAPRESKQSAFKLWLRYGKPVSGRLHVDEGARRAITVDGASLLAIGVTGCEGTFDPGDAVELVGPDGQAFAKGIVGIASSETARRARGVEVVHRDRLVAY